MDQGRSRCEDRCYQGRPCDLRNAVSRKLGPWRHVFSKLTHSHMLMSIPETQANALSTPPISIASLLVPYLSPKTDFKLKHGVIGLLKHISQTASTRQVLGEAKILQALRTSRVFSDAADISVVVQMSAINLTKHLCTHNGMTTTKLSQSPV